MLFREANPADIPALAKIRAADWGTEEYWTARIVAYLNCQLQPQEALPGRVAFVCERNQGIVGLIAGHLTRRFGCQGELQWLSVRGEFRRQGIASQLLQRLAGWFLAHGAQRICVDVAPDNQAAREFYAGQGARDLKPNWMVWDNIGRSRVVAPAIERP